MGRMVKVHKALLNGMIHSKAVLAGVPMEAIRKACPCSRCANWRRSQVVPQ